MPSQSFRDFASWDGPAYDHRAVVHSLPGSAQSLARTTPTDLIGSAISFAMGATTMTTVSFVGHISIREIIATILLPLFVLLDIRRISLLPRVHSLVLLWGAWLSSQVLSDFVNDTPGTKSLKSWASIGMILVSFLLFLMLFARNVGYFRWYLIGATTGGLIFNAVYLRTHPQLISFRNPDLWDHLAGGWALSFVLLVAIHLFRRSRSSAVLPLFLTFGLFGVVLGGRSLGGVCIFSALIWWFGTLERGRIPHLASDASLQRVVWLSIPCAVLFFLLFVTLGLKGQLDTKTAAQLKAIKNPYNPLAVLLKGRAGLRLAVAPITDRPLLGHGSKAYEPRYLRNFREIGDVREMRRAKQLRFHSVILESWVFGGVMGAVFWCYVFYCMAALLRQSLSTGDSSSVLLCSILFCSGAFGILCSPMGYARFDWPPFMAIAVVLVARMPQSRR